MNMRRTAVEVFLIVVLLVTVLVGAGMYVLRTPQEHAAAPVVASEGAIEEKTDFYSISARYPAEIRDEGGAMRHFVEGIVAARREEWKVGGEIQQSERELTAEYPDRPLPHYELTIRYEKYAAPALGFVTYAFEHYEYTGGAHGGTYLTTFSFGPSGLVSIESLVDFNNGNDIALTRLLAERLHTELGDMVDERMLAQGLGLAYLRSDGSFDSEACQCDGFFFPSNFQSFIVTDEGLRFVMQQYQVAPYAVGMPATTLTWTELAPYLEPR